MRNNQKGITLVAMVITIIVMLILAGVSISMVVGDNGVLTRASSASVKTKLASVAEDFNLAVSDVEMQYQNTFAEASTITAFKGAYVTQEKLNKVLSQSKIVTNKIYVNHKLGTSDTTAYTCKKWVTKSTNISAIDDAVFNDEHPISQLAGCTTLKAANNTKDKVFIMYLSNGADGDSLGKDFYAAVCKYESGIPILLDMGIVESEIGSGKNVNGLLKIGDKKIKKDGKDVTVNTYIDDVGKMPEFVTWLNHAHNLPDISNKT